MSYEYSDRTGLPTSLDTDQGDVIVASATYTPQGQPLTQQWGTSVDQEIFASWDYKADSLRLWETKADKDGQAGSDLALLRYHYDLAGNATQFKDMKNGNQVQCFTYDDLHRLETAFTSNDDSGNPDDCSDGYDNLGSGAYDIRGRLIS